MQSDEVVFWRGSRAFVQADLDLMREVVRGYPALTRQELAFTICEVLPWLAPNGRPKVDACLLLFDVLEGQGWVFPARQGRKARRAFGPDWGDPPPSPTLHAALSDIRPVTVDRVLPAERNGWNAMMAAYHPLGFRRAFGAHLRYFVRGQIQGERVVLGGLLFAAAAKALQARDAWLGWDPATRSRYRHHIVSSSRYLILPTVHVPHLASHALALALRRLGRDYQEVYGYRPALVETFIEPPQRGTCYRAAGFLPLGTTEGRGRQDRHHLHPESIKQVLVRPLGRHFRKDLLREDPLPEEAFSEDA